MKIVKSADIDHSNDGLKFPFFCSLKFSINHFINFYVFPQTIMVFRKIISAILKSTLYFTVDLCSLQ